MAPLRGGFVFKSENFVDNGIPIVRISNILPSGNVGGTFVFYASQLNGENYLLPNGAALLAMSGATTGKVSILEYGAEITKIYQSQRVGYFVNSGIADYSSVSTVVRSHLFITKLNSVLVTGAQPNVSPKEIDSFEFYFPKASDEQSKVGSFFTHLGHLITLHQREQEHDL